MKNILSLFLFIVVTSVGIAQTATIRGFVYDAGSGEPMIFTNVFLKGSTYGAVTDVNGYFSITKVPVGTYELQSTFLGYDTASVAVTLKANDIKDVKLLLNEVAKQLDMVEISAEQQEAKTEVKMSVQKVTPKEIQSLPSVGGEADLAQYLTVLPGVIFTGDQGGQLYIRGGSPIQNKVLMDGMVIYNPFHTIGMFSVFETEIIRNADIFTGGFGAKYGGRISSVMDITTREGNRNHFSGKLSASTFGASALLEGPLKKAKEVGGSSITYILSAKHSYLDRTSQSLYSYVDEQGLPYTYTDLYGKLSFNGSNGSKFSLFGFNYEDDVQYTNSHLYWDSRGFGANFVLVPSGSPVLIEGVFSVSDYRINQEEIDRNRMSGINSFNFGLDFTSFVRDDEIKYGLEILGFTTDFEYYNSVNRLITQSQNTTELAGYFDYRWVKNKWVVNPGFRAHYYASFPELSLEPRLGVKFNANNRLRFKGAMGRFSQNLISANSEYDVVNLFNGFLSGPDNLQEEFVNKDGSVEDVDSKLQKAWHFIIGSEYDISKKMGINVEGYYKNFTQLTSLNRYRIFDDTPENQDQPEILRKDFLVEKGQAYGIDFTLDYRYRKWYFWGVYSLAYVERYNGVITYNPVFDRRHNLNLVGTYAFGKSRDWEVSLRYNYGSGFPFTQTLGNFEQFDFTDGIGSDYVTGNGTIGTQYADINQGRLPYYSRLDFNLKKTFELGQYSTLETNLGVTNGLNRENIFYINRITKEKVYQLPFLPSLGLIWRF